MPATNSNSKHNVTCVILKVEPSGLIPRKKAVINNPYHPLVSPPAVTESLLVIVLLLPYEKNML